MKKVKVFTDCGNFWNLDSSQKSDDLIINYFLGNTFLVGFPEAKPEKIVKVEIDGVVYLQNGGLSND